MSVRATNSLLTYEAQLIMIEGIRNRLRGKLRTKVKTMDVRNIL